MASKKMVRVALDVVLTAMVVFEMFIQYTGTFLHEVVGFAFFATVVAHLALSARWMKSTAGAAKAGTLRGKRAALAVMGILLAVTMVVLGVSSVAISNLLSSAGFVWAFGSYATWATIHSVSSYALCALVTIHLAMHWAFLASVLKVPYDPSRRRAISTGVHAAAALGAVALGVIAVSEAMPQVASANPTSEGSTGASSASSEAATPKKREKGFGGPIKDRSMGAEEKSGSASSSTSKSTGSSSTSSGSSSSASDATRDDRPESSGSGYASDVESEQGSNTVTGICTLCRKQCPLSAPRCNRPYEEGLL